MSFQLLSIFNSKIGCFVVVYLCDKILGISHISLGKRRVPPSPPPKKSLPSGLNHLVSMASVPLLACLSTRSKFQVRIKGNAEKFHNAWLNRVSREYRKKQGGERRKEKKNAQNKKHRFLSNPSREIPPGCCP